MCNIRHFKNHAQILYNSQIKDLHYLCEIDKDACAVLINIKCIWYSPHTCNKVEKSAVNEGSLSIPNPIACSVRRTKLYLSKQTREIKPKELIL